MRVAMLAAIPAALALTAATAAGQDGPDVAAYLALIWSPAGALPPIVQGADVGAPLSGSLRYGRLAYRDGGDTFDNFGATIELPVSAGARTSVTIARAAADCAGCDPALGAAVDVELVLDNRPHRLGEVSVAVEPGLGFALGSGDLDYSLFTATVGLPVALRTATAVSVMPYLVPGVGYGMVSGTDDSRGGLRAMLGGGVRVQSARSGFGALVGFQKVFISRGATLFGIGVTWGGGR